MAFFVTMLSFVWWSWHPPSIWQDRMWDSVCTIHSISIDMTWLLFGCVGRIKEKFLRRVFQPTTKFGPFLFVWFILCQIRFHQHRILPSHSHINAIIVIAYLLLNSNLHLQHSIDPSVTYLFHASLREYIDTAGRQGVGLILFTLNTYSNFKLFQTILFEAQKQERHKASSKIKSWKCQSPPHNLKLKKKWTHKIWICQHLLQLHIPRST